MNNEILRHIISTIKYRFEKSIINCDENFGKFNLGKGSRNPKELINHMYHVLYSTSVFFTEEQFNSEEPEKLTPTHIGQISMMQRLNRRSINAEDFSAADIVLGIYK